MASYMFIDYAEGDSADYCSKCHNEIETNDIVDLRPKIVHLDCEHPTAPEVETK